MSANIINFARSVNTNMQKVIVYIDGFNLYFGIREIHRKDLYWLDAEKFSKNLLKDNQTLVNVKYFTSRIKFPPDKSSRQNTYIEALQTNSNIEVFFGKYQSTVSKCNSCGVPIYKMNEKKTDVNIAVELLFDAMQDHFETALLITGDSDLSGAVEKVVTNFPGKRIISVFPPQRVSDELKRVSTAYFNISKKILQSSQLPETIIKPDGYTLKRPEHWK